MSSCRPGSPRTPRVSGLVPVGPSQPNDARKPAVGAAVAAAAALASLLREVPCHPSRTVAFHRPPTAGALGQTDVVAAGAAAGQRSCRVEAVAADACGPPSLAAAWVAPHRGCPRSRSTLGPAASEGSVIDGAVVALASEGAAPCRRPFDGPRHADDDAGRYSVGFHDGRAGYCGVVGWLDASNAEVADGDWPDAAPDAVVASVRALCRKGSLVLAC